MLLFFNILHICAVRGERNPRLYADIGSLGVRRMPEADKAHAGEAYLHAVRAFFAFKRDGPVRAAEDDGVEIEHGVRER